MRGWVVLNIINDINHRARFDEVFFTVVNCLDNNLSRMAERRIQEDYSIDVI